jgi:hypothetical protein
VVVVVVMVRVRVVVRAVVRARARVATQTTAKVPRRGQWPVDEAQRAKQC